MEWKDKREVARWIIETNQPLSMVEQESFRNLPLGNTVKKVTAKTAKELLRAKQELMCARITNLLKGQKVVLITDH